ncbi:MAG: adenosylcobalamin-dependent ribonucleoside-diphosphate reductase [Bacteroidetes bacterium]|nr:adenosylcobalamin-dependent ribonucleoside-diphosphate reductase [Bacteroidota bacterium]
MKIYTVNKVKSTSLKYFNGDELAATTWMYKYAMMDKEERWMEASPDDMHQRLAKEFFRIEKKFKVQSSKFKVLSSYGKKRKALTNASIYNYFKDFKYLIPQGSVMASLGNPYVIASLSNCVVLPEIFDSYGGIFYTDQQLAQLYKRRCGVGIDISSLRPKKVSVSNAARTTSGAVSFMDRFSNTTREVAQNGRRGALMITMNIAHPDIADFISVKQDLTKVTGANISVMLTDEFMRAVEKDKDFVLRWPIEAKIPKVKIKVKAKKLWDQVIACAHNTAEPGIIFWDQQHHYSTSSVYKMYKNTSTNPCSEIAMQGGDSCRLMAVNLYSFVKKPFSEKASFDFEKFYEVVYEGQRLMDDLVDLEIEAIDRIIKKVKNDPEPDSIKEVELKTWKLLRDNGVKGRRTGLGFTALADAVAALGWKFDSAESLSFIEEMMKVKCRAEFDSSIDMAIDRGAFYGFNRATENTSTFVKMMQKEFPDVHKRMMKYGRRNVSISTVAPTGTLSLMAQSSSGIEPVFSLQYTRRRKKSAKSGKTDFKDALGDEWEEFDVFHPKLQQWMDVTGKNKIEESPYFKSTAKDIDWKKRIEIQSIVQKYTTHSISSTINLSEDSPAKKVGEIYFESWKKGLKGITVYREGSRSGVLVDKDDRVLDDKSEIIVHKAPERPSALKAKVLRFKSLLGERPYEIFTGKQDSFVIPAYINEGLVIKKKLEGQKASYDFQYVNKYKVKVDVKALSQSFNKEFWNYAKLISGVLRQGMPLEDVLHLVENLNLYDENINTWKNGVKRALKQFVVDGTIIIKPCENCGYSKGLVYEEGCEKCPGCGFSKC